MPIVLLYQTLPLAINSPGVQLTGNAFKRELGFIFEEASYLPTVILFKKDILSEGLPQLCEILILN